MKDILWISLFIPYDGVKHAGGKIHNFYLKELKKQEKFKIRLLTFAEKQDMSLSDLDQYNIENDIICYDESKVHSIARALINLESTYNPYNRYGRALQNYDILQIHRYLKRYRYEGYKPDIVILQWTQMVLLMPFVKKCFPGASVIAIEEDVTYLSYWRKMKYYPNIFLRYISRLSYKKVRGLELKLLNNADLIILNNHKDEKLIINDGIKQDKIFVWTPYFQNFLPVKWECTNHQVIFYGGMGRQENYLSAIWFAEKVMPRLRDTDIVFCVIGANPNKRLFEYASDKIKILGFVEHVEEYFSNSLCMVAPLTFGAGVKIKILEAMSAGIPVLTNEVGIEGIQAEDGREFFFCTTEEEYEEKIREFLHGSVKLKEMSGREKIFIRDHYNMNESVNKLIQYIESLGNL